MKQAFSRQNIRSQHLVGRRAPAAPRPHHPITRHQAGDIEGRHRTGNQVVNIERTPIRGHGQTDRTFAPGMQGEPLVVALALHHPNGVRPVRSKKQQIARGARHHRRREIAVVEILAVGERLHLPLEIQAHPDAAHRVIEGQWLAVAARTALQVVLFAWDPGTA